MHIALANFSLLGATGVKLPADVTANVTEKSVTDKAEVIRVLKRSMEEVKDARAGLKPAIYNYTWKSPAALQQLTAFTCA